MYFKVIIEISYIINDNAMYGVNYKLFSGHGPYASISFIISF
jgi:hypothetical protein